MCPSQETCMQSKVSTSPWSLEIRSQHIGHRGQGHESSSGFSLQELGTNLWHWLHNSRVDSPALPEAGVDSRALPVGPVMPPLVAVPLPLAACSAATDSASAALGEGGCEGGGSGGWTAPAPGAGGSAVGGGAAGSRLKFCNCWPTWPRAWRTSALKGLRVRLRLRLRLLPVVLSLALLPWPLPAAPEPDGMPSPELAAPEPAAPSRMAGPIGDAAIEICCGRVICPGVLAVFRLCLSWAFFSIDA